MRRDTREGKGAKRCVVTGREDGGEGRKGEEGRFDSGSGVQGRKGPPQRDAGEAAGGVRGARRCVRPCGSLVAVTPGRKEQRQTRAGGGIDRSVVLRG